MASDFNVDKINTDITSKNLLRNKQIAAKIPLVDANKTNANNTALQNYLMALQRTKQVKDYRNRYENLYNTILDPKYKATQDEYSELLKTEKQLREDWEKQKLTSEKLGHDPTQGTFEESKGYKDFVANKDRLEKILSDYRYNIYSAQTLASMPAYARGGTLDEREYITKLRHNQTKERAKEKQLYEQILKNNELLRKSLIKIFD